MWARFGLHSFLSPTLSHCRPSAWPTPEMPAVEFAWLVMEVVLSFPTFLRFYHRRSLKWNQCLQTKPRGPSIREYKPPFASLRLQLPRLHSSHIDMTSAMQACSGEAGPRPFARRDNTSHSSAFPASDLGASLGAFVLRMQKHGQSGKSQSFAYPRVDLSPSHVPT